MVYKFFAVELIKNETSFYTYDMFFQKYNVDKSFLKFGLEELQANKIINFVECTTENLELYTAILNQDYNKINKLMV